MYQETKIRSLLTPGYDTFFHDDAAYWRDNTVCNTKHLCLTNPSFVSFKSLLHVVVYTWIEHWIVIENLNYYVIRSVDIEFCIDTVEWVGNRSDAIEI